MTAEETPDDDLDDSMTLIQYQFEARREALVRKGSNISGLAWRWTRLDRCLINLAWASSFKINNLKHLPHSFIDHAPLFLSSSPFLTNSKHIFRFDNSWIDFLGYHNVVCDAWNCNPHGNPMHAFSHLLSCTCSNLLKWRRQGINKAESDLMNIEAEISNLENSYFNLISQFLLMDHYTNLSTLQHQCNIKWAQRAHLMWIKDGDKNTSFFYAMTCIRAHVNSISQVVDAHGNHCRDQTSIEHAFLIFYKDLWTTLNTTTVSLFDALPSNIPHISDSDAASLIRKVTKEEVYRTIIDLPTGKFPGPDDFNAEFYRNLWPIIGDQSYMAIRFFFENYFMPTSWGKTFITLIPKKDKPKSVSDFKPILLCTVNFKIISKILANRLKLVLPCLIGQEQASFVSDRCSFDNIIAMQEMVHTLESDIKKPPLGC